MSNEREISELVEQAVKESFNAQLPGLRDEVSKQVMQALQPVIKQHLELHAAQEAAKAQAGTPGGGPTDVLNAAVNSIYDAASQTDILKSLLDGAREFSARAALFVVRGNVLSAWRCAGFADESTFKGLSLDASAGLAARAIHDREPVSAAAEEFNSDFVRTHGNPTDGNANVLPLVIRDKGAAILYTDAGTDKDGKTDSSAVRLLVRAASSWLEILALRKGGGAAPEASAVESSSPELDHPAASPPPQSRSVEVAPAPSASDDSPQGLSKEDEDLHKKAKRFARLLVDEIKLYNPAKVAEGKQKKDLYDRLKEDIDKSRATYEKRYGSTSAGNADYFNAEVLRILGENDPSVLGSGFPR